MNADREMREHCAAACAAIGRAEFKELEALRTGRLSDLQRACELLRTMREKTENAAAEAVSALAGPYI